MTPQAFSDLIKSMGWTLEAAAAQLGVSRRLAAFYAKEREIPRTGALASQALQNANATRRET